MSKLNLGDSLILNSDITVDGGEFKTGATYNGYPVYCDCFTYNVGSKNGTDSVTLKTISNVRKFVNATAFNGTAYSPIIQMWTSTIGAIGTVDSTGKVIWGYSCPSSYNFGTLTVTVWYTKTTD